MSIDGMRIYAGIMDEIGLMPRRQANRKKNRQVDADKIRLLANRFEAMPNRAFFMEIEARGYASALRTELEARAVRRHVTSDIAGILTKKAAEQQARAGLNEYRKKQSND